MDRKEKGCIHSPAPTLLYNISTRSQAARIHSSPPLAASPVQSTAADCGFRIDPAGPLALGHRIANLTLGRAKRTMSTTYNVRG